MEEPRIWYGTVIIGFNQDVDRRCLVCLESVPLTQLVSEMHCSGDHKICKKCFQQYLQLWTRTQPTCPLTCFVRSCDVSRLFEYRYPSLDRTKKNFLLGYNHSINRSEVSRQPRFAKI
ncbi:hypothetical protein BKA69DRAFT_417947 [Paraphysoderma sedebokerense]|nr:hypothetical protein BKA69DRAFT_417947 [Paraphysoderma sedebokerense]